MRNTSRLSEIIGTFFFVGKSKWAPGTAGSAAGLLVLILISAMKLPGLVLYAGFAIVLIAGIWASSHYAKESQRKDPSEIVIDEVLGIWLTFWGVQLHQVLILAVGFILFRLFDVTKPLFIRKLEKLPGGFGVVADDLLAGIYANILLRLITHWMA